MYAHNRHLLRATLIVSALMPATLAAAADLPLPPPAPAWIWSGLYFGGSAGAAAGTATFSDPEGPSVFGDKVNTAAFLAGLQLGYNWQVAPRWVVGLQADASYLDSNGSFTCMQASAAIDRLELRGVAARAREPDRPRRLSCRPAGPYAPLWQRRRRVDGQRHIDHSQQYTIPVAWNAPNPGDPATRRAAMRGAGRSAPASSAR